MEYIPGYDEWKTTPPELRSSMCCDGCGDALYEGDRFYMINEERLCKNCVDEEYGRIV